MTSSSDVSPSSTPTSSSQYIHNASDLYKDQRSFLQRMGHRSLSVFREVKYSFGMIQGRFVDYYKPKFDSLQLNKSWQNQSEGLYVLVHGLNSHPAIWQAHVDLLKSETKRDLFIPYLPLKGNAPLKDVATPLLEVIETYAAQHPAKPICLIGVSNGGRICTWLETHLRSSAASTPVKVSTIAAVHFGTSRMDLVKGFHQWTGWSLGYDLSVVNDLCLGSDKAKEILDAVLAPLPEGVIREYEFFASTEDWQVPELFSSMPKLADGPKVVKHIVHGYNHNGIVAGVAIQQIESCKQWIDQFQPKLKI